MMTRAMWGVGLRRAGAVALMLTSVSCGDMARQGQSPAYLRIDELVASSGAEPGEFGATLFSDVITIVDRAGGPVPTIFADLGRVSFGLGLKDPGPASGPTSPSANNFITLDRYHVQFIRADGRNTPGLDVPYPFDGAITATVRGDLTASFELVRHIAKGEAPLAALARSPVVINTIAEITFYGHDQTGRGVSATGKMSVEFGNFGDPE
jgi:hypothetical protein